MKILSPIICSFVFAICLICAAQACADFIPRGQPPLTHVSDSGKVALIITHGIEGVFVSYSAIGSVQGFDPRQLNDTTKTIFIEYDRTRNTYTRLLTASGKEYNIQGNFDLLLGEALVSLDRQGSSYLTVVTDSGPRAAILGLSNQQLILNGEGPAVAVLKANALLSQKYTTVISRYVVGDDQQLWLGNKPFLGSQIGVSIEASNPCLQQDVDIVPSSDLAELGKVAEASKRTELLQLFKKHAKRPSSFQSLNVTPTFVAALDMQSGELGVIKEHSELSQSLCVFTPLSIDLQQQPPQ